MTRLLLALALLAPATSRAGYEEPSRIDGCRSSNGKFEITAKQVEKAKTSHGPHKWHYVWKNLESGETNEFPAEGLQGGQIYAQLFIAPDGETFALWNHLTMFWPEKSHMHASGHGDVVKKNAPSEEFRNQTIFKNRLIIYNKDGSIRKSLHIADFVNEDEWKSVMPVFNRVEWLNTYNGVNHKNAVRNTYAMCRVSPDYTVLEFLVGNPREPRTVRVSLVDGEILAPDASLSPEQTPIAFIDSGEHPHHGPAWGEAYLPSLDPVREAGTYTTASAEETYPAAEAPKKKDFQVGEVKQLAKGYKKADTPTWFGKRGKAPEEAAHLLYTDLESNQLLALAPPDGTPTPVREGATRGRAHRNSWFGLIDGKLCQWNPYGKDEPKVLLEKGHHGAEVSLNDLAVSARGLIYFTTLKDPEKGRLSVLDPATGKLTVLFDGEDHPELANPNGIALDRDERFLYVGISNYENRKASGIYAFPVKGDGTIDLDLGKDKPRIPVQAPDGITTDRQGNIYFTAGNTVHVWTPHATPLAKIKLPKGSGSNLCFGGDDRLGKTLFITTHDALYAVETPVGGF